jgi:hypothetical protein
MSESYEAPLLAPLAFDFERARLAPGETSISLTGRDVLAIVEVALAGTGKQGSQITALKREVLDAVAEGRLAEALRNSIIGAAKLQG